MAFENYPQVDPTPVNETPPSSNKNKNVKNVLLGLLVVALLGTWAYIIFDKNEAKDLSVKQDEIIATTSSQKDELQKELEDATMRFDMLKTDNSKKDSTITAKDKEIVEKRERIKAILNKEKATQSELSEARQLIASLNSDIDVYKSQVEVLMGQNTRLVAEKNVVTQQRNQALRNYDSTTMVIKEKDSKLDVGSTLRATNFDISGINEKNNKEVTTTTAKRVDKLRITFELAENMIAQSGTKEVYVCITDPDGNPVAVQALGSGMFTTRDGDSKAYTKKLNVDYTQNRRKTVTFDWNPNSNFQKGEYKIEVYNNGFKVGEAYKPLKKGGLFS